VLAARRPERTAARAEDLRRWGPEVGPAEGVARGRGAPATTPLGGADSARGHGGGLPRREGTGATVLATRGVRGARGQGAPTGATSALPPRHLVCVAAGARGLRAVCAATRAPRGATLLVEWSPLHHRCDQVATPVCRAKPTRVRVLGTMGRLRWRGAVDGAIATAEECRAAATAPPDPRRPAPLDAWITDLEARRTAIPCERERHRQRQDSGSGHAAKANDLRVARRQKNQGLHGSEETRVALMRLRTLRLNGAWDHYWQQQTFSSLLAA